MGIWKTMALALALVSACKDTGDSATKPATVPASQPAAMPAPDKATGGEAPGKAAEGTRAATAAAGQAQVAKGAEGPAADPASLQGKVGFDWRHPKKAKCASVDAAMVKTLVDGKAKCRTRGAEEAFAEGAGPWHSCELGEKEWVIYASMETCKAMFEAMQANAP